MQVYRVDITLEQVGVFTEKVGGSTGYLIILTKTDYFCFDFVSILLSRNRRRRQQLFLFLFLFLTYLKMKFAFVSVVRFKYLTFRKKYRSHITKCMQRKYNNAFKYIILI